MFTFANAGLLAAALRKAEAAHAASGEPPAGWADWYAGYLFGLQQENVFLPGDVGPSEVDT
jgi:hypothetical protein